MTFAEQVECRLRRYESCTTGEEASCGPVVYHVRDGLGVKRGDPQEEAAEGCPVLCREELPERLGCCAFAHAQTAHSSQPAGEEVSRPCPSTTRSTLRRSEFGGHIPWRSAPGDWPSSINDDAGPAPLDLATP
jgi:hypothetical protein